MSLVNPSANCFMNFKKIFFLTIIFAIIKNFKTRNCNNNYYYCFSLKGKEILACFWVISSSFYPLIILARVWARIHWFYKIN